MSRIKIILFIYTAFLVLLAVLPINNGEMLDDVFILHIRGDYLVHFAIFIPFMALIWLYTGNTFFAAPRKAFAWISFALLLALLTEFIQFFLPYRSFNINDMTANGIGVVLGSGIFFFERKSKNKINPKSHLTKNS